MKISRYSQDSQPSMADKVIGTNTGDHDNTYNFTFQAIYALFTGNLNQLFVPYTGATTDVYLGNYGLKAIFLIADTDLSVGRTMYLNGDPGMSGSVPESQGDAASPLWIQKVYGDFSCTDDQTTASLSVVPVLFPNAIHNTSGVTVEDNGSTGLSRITVSTDGVYEISVTLQGSRATSAGNADPNIIAFLSKNGVDVPYSAVSQTLTVGTGSVSSQISFSKLLDMASGDYVEVLWTQIATAGQDEALLSSAAPFGPFPGVPSAYVSVKRIR
jgi:hypothetical protein